MPFTIQALFRNFHVSVALRFYPRRFETIFYAGFLDEGASAGTAADTTEVTDALWTDPDSILEDSREEKLWLAPPQVYELHRMRRSGRDFSELRRGCRRLSNRHLPTWMPVLIRYLVCKRYVRLHMYYI